MQLILFYVAPMLGFVGHNQAANFERHYHKRPWGTPPAVWGIACVVLGPVAGCALLVAEHSTARRLGVSRAVAPALQSAPPMQPWISAQPPLLHPPQYVPAPQPRPATPRRVAPRVAQPSLRSQHVLPQPHPTDVHRMYLFGIPQAQAEQQCTAPAARGWSTPQYGGVPAGNVGGTDLLPRRDSPRRRRS